MRCVRSGSVWLLVVLLFGQARCRAAPEFEESGAAARSGAAPGENGDDGSARAASGGAGGTSSATGGKGGTSSSGGAQGANGGSSSANGSGGGGSAKGGTSSGSGGSAASDDASDDAGDGAGARAEPGDHGNDGAAGDAPVVTASGGTSGGSTPLCDAQSVSLDEIRRGEVRSNVKVSLDAIATSQKFLLSHTSSGGCLFGVFLGAEPTPTGPRGVLVVSYGEDAPGDDACPTGTDAIPDDIAPGDTVSAAGYVTSYAPSGCGAAPAPQLMVDATCPFERRGHAEAPAPYVLSLADADALARGTDATRVRQFAGGLVQLEQLSAKRPSDGVGAVGPYGVIQFSETGFELHNDLAYGDLTLGGPGDPQKSLVFPYPTQFASVTGLVHLDYCTWSLLPRSGCHDLAPPSGNCP